MRVLAGVFLALFLVSQIGETFAQRGRGGGGGGGGGFGSYNTYRSTGGGYRSYQPAPMTPRYTAAPRQMAPGAAYPRGPSGGPSVSSAPRSLPKSISAGSPVAASPAFAGKVTKAGSPIITVRTGKTFSVPQQGVFATRTITTIQRFKTQLMATTASGQRIVIKERVTQVALGKKTVVAKVGGTPGRAIGLARGEAISAFADVRLQHASRHLTDAGLLPKWNKSTGEKFKEIGVPILESPSKTFDHTLGGTPVKGFVGTVQGKTVVLFVFKSGSYQGQVATAVVPSSKQALAWGI